MMIKKKMVACITALAMLIPMWSSSFSIPTYAAGEAVQVWLSNPNTNTWLTRKADLNFAGTSTNADYTFTVNSNTTYQTMDGFGASLTDASAWLLHNQLSATKRTEVMNKLFGPSGINISALRQPMGASDFNWEAWTYNDTTNNVDDMSLSGFSLWREDAYIRPMLDQAYNVNKGRIKIFAAPWSPPAWMKTGKSLYGNTGGTLRTDAYNAYANYFVKYLKQYSAKGTPVYAISVQNEPKFAPHWPGMLMSTTEQINFINVLGPKLVQNNLNTKILAYDHNYDDINYPGTVLGSSASSYVSGSAFHYYSALTHSNLTTLHNQYPNKDIWFTEGGSGTWIGGGTDKGMFQDLMMHTIRFPRNWAKSYIMWNIALDQNSGPALSGIDGTNRGLITIRSDATNNVTYNPQYYGLGHSSKFVDPGAYRINSNTFQDQMESVAYRNPNGSIALILSNRLTSAKTVKIKWGTQSFTYQVPAEGAVTFKWTSGTSGSGGSNGSGDNQYLAPAVGQMYQISAKSSGMSLDVADVSTVNGANVQQWGYSGGNNQKWYLKDAGGGYFNIMNVNSDKGLDVESASTANGGNVQQWQVSGSGGNNQQWQVVSVGNGYYKIVNRASEKALQIANDSIANGGNVQQWTYTGADNQLFYFQAP